MKRMLLELGGKGAALVFDDADVKTAVQMIGSVWTFHSGQICTAPTRAIVQRPIYEQVVEGLAKMAKVLKVGDPYEPDTVVGPVITAQHRDRVESYVRAGREEGGEILAGGERPEKPDRGYYVAPTLIAGCRPGMKVVQEEIFGPGDRRRSVRRRRRRHRDLERHRLRPLRLRVQRRHEPRVPRRASACAPATSASTRRSATTTRRSAGTR